MGWAALSELVPYYPLYALLFLDTGLSDAQVSVLFAIWSVTALLTEVPAGALADRWSRRGAVVLASLLQAVAFVVLDLITPGRLGEHLMEPAFHPASLVSAAVQLAVAAIIVASIWP